MANVMLGFGVDSYQKSISLSRPGIPKARNVCLKLRLDTEFAMAGIDLRRGFDAVELRKLAAVISGSVQVRRLLARALIHYNKSRV